MFVGVVVLLISLPLEAVINFSDKLLFYDITQDLVLIVQMITVMSHIY